MSEWTNTLKEIGLSIFGRETSGEMWAMVVICVLVAFLLYKKMSSGFVGQGEKTFLTLIPGVLIMIAAVAAVRIYLDGSFFIQLAAVLVCFLGIILPITMRVEKTRYFTAMIPWGVTALVLAVILYLEPLVMQSLQRGVEKGSLMKDHRDESESLLK